MIINNNGLSHEFVPLSFPSPSSSPSSTLSTRLTPFQIAGCIDKIKGATTYRDPMVSLPHEMYLIIRDFIEHIISEDQKGTYENIILLGGIHINTPIPMEGQSATPQLLNSTSNSLLPHCL